MFTQFLGKPFRFFILMGKKHRAEWYIVVVGGIILSVIIFMSIFAPLLS